MRPWDTEIEQIFQSSYHIAYRAAKAICMDAALAEDAVSEALLRMWKRLQKQNGVENAQAYFVRIAVNEAKRVVAKQVGISSQNIEDYADRVAAQNDDSLVYREAAAELLREVEKLPKGMRLPIKLHYYGGFSEKEAAQMLGISYAACKTRLSRARAKLKAVLEKERQQTGGEYHEV